MGIMKHNLILVPLLIFLISCGTESKEKSISDSIVDSTSHNNKKLSENNKVDSSQIPLGDTLFLNFRAYMTEDQFNETAIKLVNEGKLLKKGDSFFYKLTFDDGSSVDMMVLYEFYTVHIDSGVCLDPSFLNKTKKLLKAKYKGKEIPAKSFHQEKWGWQTDKKVIVLSGFDCNDNKKQFWIRYSEVKDRSKVLGLNMLEQLEYSDSVKKITNANKTKSDI